MEAFYSHINCIQGYFVKDRMPDQVTEIQKCAERMHYTRGNMASYGWQIYLTVEKSHEPHPEWKCDLLTFISALELSPVHCLNPWPSGNRHSAGKDGTAAILVTSQWVCGDTITITYLWSISAMISLACCLPCSSSKNSLIQVMRWSLNVPLISWCRRSGVISSWISAHGKSEVKGYLSIVS